uniref:synaptoporin-like isoform X2 n=1 Tax=Myxine glutinosa TaxID=7769 RepID=UPI00358F41EC
MCMVIFAPIFAIFAFATCCGYHGQVTIMVHCKNQSAPPSIIHVPVEFPFSFPTMSVRLPSCVRPPGAGATTQPFFIRGSSLLPGAAQMFVAVGVMALLYCVLATVVYIFFQHKYLVDNRGPRVDFAVSIAFAALWLSSSLLWARALSELKSTLVPGTLAAPIAACRSQTSTRCSSEAPPIMPALDVSVVVQWSDRCKLINSSECIPLITGKNSFQVFGLVNFVLWAGNVWFVFKETGWRQPSLRPLLRHTTLRASIATTTRDDQRRPTLGSSPPGSSPSATSPIYNQFDNPCFAPDDSGLSDFAHGGAQDTHSEKELWKAAEPTPGTYRPRVRVPAHSAPAALALHAL